MKALKQKNINFWMFISFRIDNHREKAQISIEIFPCVCDMNWQTTKKTPGPL